MPLRFPRLAMAPAAIGLAAACLLLSSAATLADQARHQEWWLRTLHVTQAWPTTEGSGVTVAVLDTGTNPAQPDLAGSVLPGPDFTNSGETPASPYFYGHGTAVASLIAGHGHGSRSGGGPSGVIGVAPAARILSVRVTLGAGDPLLANATIAAGLPGAIAAGINYAVRQGAQVIDLPLDPGQASADGTPGAAAAAGGSAAEQSAIGYALRHGVVVVAPAGDDGAAGNAVNYPAAYPGVISVGSFNLTFIKSPFSVRQKYVTLTAAGEGVIAAAIPSGYAVMNSTSAASAIVAGMAALIKSQFPELTPGQVARALENGTVFRPNGKTGDGSGAGTADAARALAAAAALAGPGASRAGTGAQPQVLPAAPPLPTIPQNLTSARLRKDGIISAAVLALLLLSIGVFAALRRRRDGSPASDEERWRERERYPEPEGSNAEPELAYLAAPAARAGYPPASRAPHAASPPRAAASLSSPGLSAAGLRAAGGERDTAGADPVWGSTPGRESVWGGTPVRESVGPESAGGDTAWGESAWGAATAREPDGREPDGREPGGREPPWGEPDGREPAGREPPWDEPGGREPPWGESAGRAGRNDFAGFESLARSGRPASSADFSGPGGASQGDFPEHGQDGGFPQPGENGFDSFAKPSGISGSDAHAGASAGPGGPGGPGGPSVSEVGLGGFSGSSSFTGLSPRSGGAGRPSAAGQVPGPTLAPVTRPAVSRPPKVSGSPPWEPAVKPDSELPWANMSPPPAASARGTVNLPRRMSRPVWDIAASGADGTGPGRADDAERSAGQAAGAASETSDADDAPIYVWNPGATTETFPSVPRRED